MTTKLKDAFAPESLVVTDNSAAHAGHAGNPHGRGETHFTVEIVSKAFSGKNRLEIHRMINEVLAEELSGPVHALTIKAHAPA